MEGKILAREEGEVEMGRRYRTEEREGRGRLKWGGGIGGEGGKRKEGGENVPFDNLNKSP